jgi:hypothetical protein
MPEPQLQSGLPRPGCAARIIRVTQIFDFLEHHMVTRVCHRGRRTRAAEQDAVLGYSPASGGDRDPLRPTPTYSPRPRRAGRAPVLARGCSYDHNKWASSWLPAISLREAGASAPGPSSASGPGATPHCSSSVARMSLLRGAGGKRHPRTHTTRDLATAFRSGQRSGCRQWSGSFDPLPRLRKKFPIAEQSTEPTRCSATAQEGGWSSWAHCSSFVRQPISKHPRASKPMSTPPFMLVDDRKR